MKLHASRWLTLMPWVLSSALGACSPVRLVQREGPETRDEGASDATDDAGVVNSVPEPSVPTPPAPPPRVCRLATPDPSNDTRTVSGAPSWVELATRQLLAVGVVRSPDAFCTGTLVSPAWVVTAKSCVESMTAGGPLDSNAGLEFLTGSDPRVQDVRLPARAVYHHPDPSTDLSLVELNIPSRGSLLDVSPVLLARDVTLTERLRVESGGYGELGGLVGARRFALGEVEAWTQSTIDVLALDAPGACAADAGGPLFMRGSSGEARLLGVLASSGSDCEPRSRFVRAQTLVQWIEEESTRAVAEILPTLPEPCEDPDTVRCDGDSLLACADGVSRRVPCDQCAQVCRQSGDDALCASEDVESPPVLEFPDAGLTPEPVERHVLFNGVDLSNWQVSVAIPTELEMGALSAEDLFHVSTYEGEPVIHVYQHTPINAAHAGFAVLATEEQYERYRLHVEYLWGDARFKPYDEPGERRRDSGIHYHVPNPFDLHPAGVPISREIQLMQRGSCTVCGGLTGDGLGLNVSARSYTIDGFFVPKSEGGQVTEAGRALRGVVDKTGDWNTIEVVIDGSERGDYFLNGQLVNQVFDVSVQRGHIALQARASEIFFKNVWLDPIDDETPVE